MRVSLQRSSVYCLAAVWSAQLFTPAGADELVMPFTCSVEHGSVVLKHSAPTAMAIVGRRDEKSVTTCGGDRAGSCQIQMVHRFAAICGGEKLSWVRIAEASRQVDIEMPRKLPAGFAPVGPFGGRFVLPALLDEPPTAITKVSMEALGSDTVDDRLSTVGTLGDGSTASSVGWAATISPEFRVDAGWAAADVAMALAGLLLALFAISMMAAGRMTPQPAAHGAVMAGRREWFDQTCRQTWTGLRTALHRAFVAASAAGAATDRQDEDLVGAGFATAQARVIETDLKIATLPPGILLRDVLTSELDGVRRKLFELERNTWRRDGRKTEVAIRQLIAALDRIGRIAQGAADTAERPSQMASEIDMPQSPHEAYRMLGLNPDAPPAAAKKLVDALRMSWHPDHARDEADRLRREERMKQINAAWEMVKGRREAA